VKKRFFHTAVLFSSIFSAILIPANQARGQSAGLECNCTTPVIAGQDHIGSISFAQGEILASRQAGFEPVSEGALLYPGDAIMSGAASSVTISVGQDCNVSAGPNQQLTVVQNGDSLCVRSETEQLGQTAFNPLAGTPGNPPQVNLPLVTVLGLSGAGLALALGDDGDDGDDGDNGDGVVVPFGDEGDGPVSD
jgi:hypothetical protein